MICYDPLHVVAPATKALDVVRREVWNELRRVDAAAATRFKGVRWALLKNPTDLNHDQAATLRRLRRHGGDLALLTVGPITHVLPHERAAVPDG